MQWAAPGHWGVSSKETLYYWHIASLMKLGSQSNGTQMGGTHTQT
jgi:hypothetical protein